MSQFLPRPPANRGKLVVLVAGVEQHALEGQCTKWMERYTYSKLTAIPESMPHIGGNGTV